MKKLKKIILILLTIAILMQPIMSALSAYAAEVGSYDNTTIESDLGADTIKLYPKVGYGDCEVIHVLEYAYSEHSSYQKLYNVYIYVYNPTGNAISVLNEGYNLVSMVTGYGENGDKEINTVALEYVSRTSDKLIYKFKLAKQQEIYAFVRDYASTHGGVRRYEFSKLQVKQAGGLTETKEFAKIYEFSGYSAYCDKDKSPESTLQCKDFVNSTIQLQLQHTNYRAEEQKNGIQDEINSVYFSIPDRYYNESENLYGVNAEWYEYKSKLIYVTSDGDAYAGLWPMLTYFVTNDGQIMDPSIGGGVIEVEGVNPSYSVFWNEWFNGDIYYFGDTYCPYISDYIDDDGFWDNTIFGDGSGSLALGTYNGLTVGGYSYEPRMDWLIKVDDIQSDNAYKVSSEKVKEFMLSYTNNFSSQPKILDKYASGLFEESIDADRIQFLDDAANGATSGKITKKFTSDESFVFTDSDKTQSKWNEFWLGTKYVDVPYSPIVVISEGDLYLDADAFSQKYYVSKQDVADVQEYAKTSYSKAETPVLLRFAVTDYYSSEACFDYALDDEFPCLEKYNGIVGNGYVAQETMFLDFNVIELEFKNDEGVIRSVGAVAEPIDIINGLTPPDSLVEDEEWWQKLVALILAVIILLVLYFVINVYVPWLGAIIRWVAGAFWWLFTSILKLITWPLRSLFSKASRKVKRKLNIRSPRGKGKGRRGRPKKEARSKRMMRNASGEIKAKASETISSAKQKLLEKIADIKNKNKEE